MANSLVRAYVLIEMAANQPAWTDDNDGAIGFGMCKGLYHRIWTNEVVLHLQCEGHENLNKAITKDIPQLKGVKRVTTLMVTKD